MSEQELMEANPPRRDQTGAPNPDHYANNGEYLDAVAEWDRKMELAAGKTCCGDNDDTP